MASKKAPAKGEPEKVLRCGIEKDDARYVYFVDRRGNLMRMERGVPKPAMDVVIEKAVKRERGFMYYLDDDGDLVKEPDSSRDG